MTDFVKILELEGGMLKSLMGADGLYDLHLVGKVTEGECVEIPNGS